MHAQDAGNTDAQQCLAAIPASALWPEGRPRPRGEMGRLYRLFVQSAIRSLADAQFVPALIGGCAVDRVAEVPFVFGLRR